MRHCPLSWVRMVNVQGVTGREAKEAVPAYSTSLVPCQLVTPNPLKKVYVVLGVLGCTSPSVPSDSKAQGELAIWLGTTVRIGTMTR